MTEETTWGIPRRLNKQASLEMVDMGGLVPLIYFSILSTTKFWSPQCELLDDSVASVGWLEVTCFISSPRLLHGWRVSWLQMVRTYGRCNLRHGTLILLHVFARKSHASNRIPLSLALFTMMDSMILATGTIFKTLWMSSWYNCFCTVSAIQIFRCAMEPWKSSIT